MSPLSRNVFFKQVTCPSSEMLLSHYSASLADGQYQWIAAHLMVCDFCGAEFQLLTEYAPADEEEYAVVDIPLGLRCLAESLLCDEITNPKTLTEAGFEKERLTLTDA